MHAVIIACLLTIATASAAEYIQLDLADGRQISGELIDEREDVLVIGIDVRGRRIGQQHVDPRDVAQRQRIEAPEPAGQPRLTWPAVWQQAARDLSDPTQAAIGRYLGAESGPARQRAQARLQALAQVDASRALTDWLRLISPRQIPATYPARAALETIRSAGASHGYQPEALSATRGIAHIQQDGSAAGPAMASEDLAHHQAVLQLLQQHIIDPIAGLPPLDLPALPEDILTPAAGLQAWDQQQRDRIQQQRDRLAAAVQADALRAHEAQQRQALRGKNAQVRRIGMGSGTIVRE